MSAPRRPLSLLITIVAIFLLAIWNLWRAAIILRQRPLIEEIGPTLPPEIRLVMAIVWSILFVVLAVALWRRKPTMRIFLPLSVLIYGGYHLFMTIFMPAPAARETWPLQVIALVAAVVWTGWVGKRMSTAVRTPQRVTDEHDNAHEHLMPYESPFAFKVVQRGKHGKSKN